MNITISTITALNALIKCRSWEGWMLNWIRWDEAEQVYIGASPDEEELCRGVDPSKFIQLFKEGADEWSKQQNG